MSTLGGPLQTAGRNIWALILRDMQTQFGNQSLGYLWALMEPLGMIIVLGLIFHFAGRSAPLGESSILFFATGVIPLRIYTQTVGKVSKAVKRGQSMLYFPIIKPIDVFIAPVFLQASTMFLVLVVFFLGFQLFEGEGLPDDWFGTFLPLFFLAMFGFSIGVINAVIIRFFSAWEKIWKLLNRPTFLLSGIFFLADSMPHSVQQFLYFNPFLHCIEWIRTGYYAGYESQFYDPSYVLATLGVLMFLALLLERMFRRQIMESV